MSESPRCWGAAWEDRARQAASRGRRPSRLLRSRCCWSPGRWGSTAQRARPGPGTPVGEGGGREVRAGGRDSNPRHETTVELWVIVCERQLCGETHICGGHR